MGNGEYSDGGIFGRMWSAIRDRGERAVEQRLERLFDDAKGFFAEETVPFAGTEMMIDGKKYTTGGPEGVSVKFNVDETEKFHRISVELPAHAQEALGKEGGIVVLVTPFLLRLDQHVLSALPPANKRPWGFLMPAGGSGDSQDRVPFGGDMFRDMVDMAPSVTDWAEHLKCATHKVVVFAGINGQVRHSTDTKNKLEYRDELYFSSTDPVNAKALAASREIFARDTQAITLTPVKK